MSFVYFCFILQWLSAAPGMDLHKVPVLTAAQDKDPSTTLCLFPKYKVSHAQMAPYQQD